MIGRSNAQSILRVPSIISVGDDLGTASARSTITASVAVQLEGFSLVVVAYTALDGSNSVGIVSQM